MGVAWELWALGLIYSRCDNLKIDKIPEFTKPLQKFLKRKIYGWTMIAWELCGQQKTWILGKGPSKMLRRGEQSTTGCTWTATLYLVRLVSLLSQILACQ